MKIILIISGILFLALGIFWYFGRKPYKHKNVSQKEISTFLNILLHRGFNGGVLMIEIPGSDYFIQFSKYIIKVGNIGLQLGFPKAPWSKDLFANLEKLLRENSFSYRLEKVTGGDVSEFLIVDLKMEIERAVILARLILESVFKVSSEQLIDVYLWNVSHLDEKVVPVKGQSDTNLTMN